MFCITSDTGKLRMRNHGATSCTWPIVIVFPSIASNKMQQRIYAKGCFQAISVERVERAFMTDSCLNVTYNLSVSF